MKKRERSTKVPARVIWLILLTSFGTIGYGYLLTAISAYLPELGVGSDQVGLILGASGVAMILTAIPFGILSDRIGRKWILIIGTCGIPPTMLLCALSNDPSVYLLASIIGGISEGALLSTWNAMIADQTTVDNRDMAFSLSFIIGGAFNGIGLALPILFPLVHDTTGWSSQSIHSATFLILGVVSLLTPISLRHLLRDYKEHAPGAKVKRKLLKGRSKNVLLKFSVNNTMIGLGAGLIIPLIPTWFFLQYGIQDTYSGPLLALSSLSIGFAAIFSARLSRRTGAVKAIAMTQASSTIFMLAIPFMPGAAAAGAVYLLRSALMNMAGPIMDSYLMGIVDKDDRGLASAINSIVWRIPNSATTLIGGILLASGNYALPFVLAAVIYLIAVTAFYLNFKDVVPEDQTAPT